MNRLKNEKRISLPLAAFCLALAVFLCYKWWKVFLGVCTGVIFSDVPLHIELALGHNDYGLSSLLIQLFYLGGEAFAQRALALSLTVNNLIGLLTVALLVRFLLPRLSRLEAFLAAELAALCGPWLIPGYQMGVYLNAYNGNLYHNMTMLFSRTLIPVSFVCFFRCWSARHGRIPRKDWWGFAISFFIVTAFKPNFAFAFLPVLAVLLLWDLIRYKGKYFKNEFLLGCAVLPAGFLCIWQYLVLFNNSFGQSATEMLQELDENFVDTSSGMALRLLWGVELAAVLVMYLRSLLLPVYTLALQGWREKERRRIGLFLAVEAVALLEATVLVETGYRANHGNFDWGGLALYSSVFALAIGLLIRMLQEAKPKKPLDVFKCLVGLGLLLGHLMVGLYFLWFFGSGGSYFI
ncbi:MAG: hypothetical protein SPF74_10605 [Candidatus Limivicinus sp.]|nr:hypothetical protein [Candidatus Limivicinus sp.]